MITWAKNTYQTLDVKYATHMKIMRYIISGGTAAVVDLVALYILTDFFHIWYVISTPVAFGIAFGVSFGLQKYWTFRDHSSDGIAAQGTLYLVVSIVNLFANSFLVFAFTDFLHVYYILSQIVAGALIAVSSFFIYQKFIFVQRASTSAVPTEPHQDSFL